MIQQLKKSHKIHVCGHPPRHLSANAVQQFDPTHTLTLRNAFARDMNKRFTELRGIIRQAIVDEDVFGLTNPPTVLQLSTPGQEAFAFSRSGQKVNQFMSWLKEQEQLGILEVNDFGFGIQFGQGIEPAWTDKYIQSGYQAGIKQARQEMRKAGFDVPTIEASGGIEAAFNNPLHIDRVGLLFSRTFNDLKGITGTMDGQISRMLAKGLAEGQNPNTIARWLTKTISGPVGDTLAITDTLGRFIPAQRRAKMLARTEIIRAHAEGTLQEFKNFGVAGVKVRAEFVTAGDDRVCAECEALEAEIFTIEEARGIIPVHPSCFKKYTLIKADQGNKYIYEIEEGDKILTRKGYKKVLETSKRKYSGVMMKVGLESGVVIDCTVDHPIWKDNDGFVRADQLKKYDSLLNFGGQLIMVEQVDFFDDITDVYNLTIEDQPEFYANGILVHNCRCAWLPVTVN